MLLENGADISCVNANGKGLLEVCYLKYQLPHLRPCLEPVIQMLLSRICYKTQKTRDCSIESFPYTPEVLIEKLQATDDPNGYSPLENPMPFDRSLIEEGKKVASFECFEKMQVEIVPDDYEGPLNPKQVRRMDAGACQILFEQIQKGESCIQVEPAGIYKEVALTWIKKLLTRPSGRALIYKIHQSNYPVLIMGNNHSSFAAYVTENSNFPHFVTVNFSRKTSLTVLNNETFEKKEGQGFISLGHELLHVLLHISSPQCSNLLLRTKSSNPFYTNLNEQFVMTGLKGHNFLCENMLRFEFGEPPRWGHLDVLELESLLRSD